MNRRRKSPFKFLDSYTREDEAIFFGRKKETDALYELVKQNRLVLLYGASGLGKTSLIQCGLGNRFHKNNWFPLFIRRGNDTLSHSLRKNIEQALGEEFEGSLTEALEELYMEYLRPIYLIFDQMEEIFVLGDEDGVEQAQFIQDIAEINASKLNCQVIFSLREEYLGHLYAFEQVIPTLFDSRLRVEPMNAQNVKEVIQHSCEKFNISLKNPDKNTKQIIQKVSDSKSGVSLPYLQVYLDRLYQEDIVRTYGENVPNTPLPELEFTAEEIDSLGDIGDVLKIFLQEQRERIQSELQGKYPGSPEQSVRKILNSFASLEGTKIPRNKADIKLPGLNEESLTYILDELQQSRILREEGGTYELAHDTLSLRISEQRSAADIALLEAADLVQGRMRAFERTAAYLNVKELQLIENYAVQLKEEEKLKPEAWDFVKESQRHVKREENRRKLITGGVITILVAFLTFAGWQWWQAEKSKDEAISEKKTADSLLIVSEESNRQALAEQAKAEESNQEALAQKDKADSLFEISSQALKKMKLAQKDILNHEINTKDQAIYELDYDLAYESLQLAIALEIPSNVIREGILELAYYYNEMGRAGRRDSLLSQVAGYRKNLSLTRSQSNPRETKRKEILRLAGNKLFDSWENRYYPTMVNVEGGTFWMGDSLGLKNETPHQVQLDDFQMGKYELTVYQYELYLKSQSQSLYNIENTPSWGWQGDNPMIYVSWYDATHYANWLSERKGLEPAYIYTSDKLDSIKYSANGYRLPTEAEWEYAAGGGISGRNGSGHRNHIYAGSDSLNLVAWYRSNSNSTKQVGQKLPNELGLYDMSGNVWEWCQDWYKEYNLTDTISYMPVGPSSGSSRVLRGGSWSSLNYSCRVSARSGRGGYNNLLGFRLTRRLP